MYHVLWEKFKIYYKMQFSQFVEFNSYIVCSRKTVALIVVIKRP